MIAVEFNIEDEEEIIAAFDITDRLMCKQGQNYKESQVSPMPDKNAVRPRTPSCLVITCARMHQKFCFASSYRFIVEGFE